MENKFSTEEIICIYNMLIYASGHIWLADEPLKNDVISKIQAMIPDNIL